MSEQSDRPDYEDGSGRWRPDPNNPYLNQGWEDLYPEQDTPDPSPQPEPAEPPTAPTERQPPSLWASGLD